MAAIRFDSKFLKKLDHLMLRSRGVYSGDLMGGRRSRRRGVGLEFADHRSYSPGDDFRYLDWNVLGRLDELFLKVFEMEEDLYVYVLIDCSGSMDFGDPTKLDVAKMTAAALSYIGLAKQDIVRVSFFSEDLIDKSELFKGRDQIFRVFDFLNQERPSGKTSLTASLRNFVKYTRRHGIVIILSDFLDPGSLEEGLKFLVHNRFGVYGLHVIDPREERPDLVGDLNLTDTETGESLPLNLRRNTIDAYRQVFQEHCQHLKRFMNSYNGRYMQVPTHTSLEDLFLRVFRREGLFT